MIRLLFTWLRHRRIIKMQGQIAMYSKRYELTRSWVLEAEKAGKPAGAFWYKKILEAAEEKARLEKELEVELGN